ncbi:uncharacterized protein (DUF342 family) [Pullulanibacillus pueri]|uniref:RNA-binding protein KhpB N-terminal domain-containing protein n=1 Tax=Pullulanibacillus pueri TaxID=1437324 RepID=A0A8J2ZW92_9BACL|nr:flagellar assembly protein A [Pullulanibacillus pueri]MBM7682787.1 uncharacterized protein (DUF342 family) [Pullulanibacillus pueri]GGH83182.1 hypothetical protein GCM10007096_23670 [Pullulanibacillus pueri]
MQSIISKGKNVKEAITLGLELLNVGSKDVNVEIIQQESKGMFGIGARKAIVKLTVLAQQNDSVSVVNAVDVLEETLTREEKHQQPQMDPGTTLTQEKHEGKVWVKAGRLYCKSSPTQFPTVTLGKGVTLLKNGEPVAGPTVVLSEHDLYKIVLKEDKQETKWHVKMDQLKLKVILQVEPGYQMTRQIPDYAPDEHITLEAEEVKQVVNTLSYGDVMVQLENLRVKQGFIQDNILKAIAATVPSEFEIAVGTRAKDGKDGWFELKVDVDTKKGLQEDDDGKVDFREVQTIPTVQKGQVIAVIHPPIPGEPGVTVTNEPLPPKQTYPVELKLGRGVMVVDDKVVALESGRPKVEQRGQLVRISILEKLFHPKDVDLESGNLRFMGDIEIFGNVKEHMRVEADGDVLVHAAVNFATITSKSAIIVKKTVNSSELSAGKHNILVAECGHMLGILHEQLQQMNAIINDLLKSAAFKHTDISQRGLQPLIKLLLEKRFKSIIPLSKQYVDVVLKGKDYFESDDWREIAVTLKQIFLSLSQQMITLERLKELSERSKRLHEWSKIPVEPEAYITLHSVQNSHLYSSGDITIIGQGCVNTKVHAGGRLNIEGIVRGGEIYGKLGVAINEVGSEMGTRTIVSVPQDQTIRIKKVMEGTILKIGTMKYTINETCYHISAYLNRDGEIAFN